MSFELISFAVLEVIKLILSRRVSERNGLMLELHDAHDCAHKGDCSALEKLLERLKETK